MKALSYILVIASLCFIACEKENIPPTCEIINPENNSEYEVGDLITISVEAEDEDGTVTEVRFFINDIGANSATSWPYNYDWDTEDEDDGVIKIKVSAKDDKGGLTEDEISILLNPEKEAPVAAFTADNPSITKGGSVQFTDESTNEPTTWEWDFGDGSTSTEQNPSHIYIVAGSYEVSLTATNIIGSDSETKSDYITVTTNAVGGETGTVVDIDRNSYNTIIIGTQEWMTENLKTGKYNDGTAIPLVTDARGWSDLTTPGYCYYENDDRYYKDIYGALYNWYAVDTDKLCPSGWHVPTHAEWTELENFLIASGYNYDGTTSGNKIGKSLATTSSWTLGSDVGAVGNDQASNNTTGFSALPGGARYNDGNFYDSNEFGYWWSSTETTTSEASVRLLHYLKGYLAQSPGNKKTGFSVRCIKDE